MHPDEQKALALFLDRSKWRPHPTTQDLERKLSDGTNVSIINVGGTLQWAVTFADEYEVLRSARDRRFASAEETMNDAWIGYRGRLLLKILENTPLPEAEMDY